MDKKIILSVAGSGKTSLIVEKLNLAKKYIILTYTNANYDNLCNKVRIKFGGTIPSNIFIYKFDFFLFNILFKAMYSDSFPELNGIEFDSSKINRFIGKDNPYYWNNGKMVYSARLSFKLLSDELSLIQRIHTITDCLVIDEVQDIGSRDFDLIMSFSKSNIELLYVGDFYQHTYQTSADNNYKQSLFNDFDKYVKCLKESGFAVDDKTLKSSYRCSKSVCNYVSNNLGIDIVSHRSDETVIKEIVDKNKIKEVWNNNDIVKLHYQLASNYVGNHRNWGDVKGEDNYNDVCIVLNKSTFDAYKKNKLKDLPPGTKAKLYVAITRARGNVYFLNYNEIKDLDLIL